VPAGETRNGKASNTKRWNYRSLPLGQDWAKGGDGYDGGKKVKGRKRHIER